MRPRLKAMKRLMALYGLVEEAHSAELQRTTAAVREAQQAIGIQMDVARSARIDGRRALRAGDCIGWTAAEALREATGSKRRRLEAIRLERQSLSDGAREKYAASRLKSEQMKRVVARVMEQSEVEECRKAQAISDDRFLARRHRVDVRGDARADSR